MKIYTKTGDGGETGLFGGKRVSKGVARVEAYGTVDELNAHIGWAVAQLDGAPQSLLDVLLGIQSDLLTVGADLATPPDTPREVKDKTVSLNPEAVERLEAVIDRFDDEVPPLRHFILPGGVAGAAALQVCRAVCRRAERSVVRLERVDEVNTEVLAYLNRLSDCLFVLSRWVNAREGRGESVWNPGGRAG